MAGNEENKKSEAALREEAILSFWQENKIFEKSLEQSAGRKKFIFYEGPPTANAKPGIHHLAARAFKDAIPRYKTMRGFHVRRKGGWDTHGLPVELQVEKKLGLNSKKAIEEYGVAKFNQECRGNVWEQIDLWTKFTERIGYWIDQKNPYVTYDSSYIESVWNILAKINNQGLLYKDYKVVPWCPRCGTALSSHELAQGYEDVKDLSVYTKFKVVGQENTYILAWTTTPWTLPGNIALAVGEKIDYVKIKNGEEQYILGKEKLRLLFDDYVVLDEMEGKDLVGLEYEPPFSYLKENLKKKGESLEKTFRVYSAPFVNVKDGTGIVHTAVMYGQDDFELGTKVGLPKLHLVDEAGHFIGGMGFLEGRFVKDEETSVEIIKDLAHRGILFKKEKYQHSYPHCWRCKTPLIYYARDSWYIQMSDKSIKRKLIAKNKRINWEPVHIKDGRFGEWLREVKDWAISRERYWGTPLPVWECARCDKREVIGSLQDLKSRVKKSGNKYFVARHGEATANVNGMISWKMDENNKLTEKGTEEVKKNAKKLKKKDFDLIFSSPLPRAKASAEIIAETLGFERSKIIFDDRLWELKMGDLDGKKREEYVTCTKAMKDYFATPFPNGESRMQAHTRVGEFIYELEEKYKDKKILIVTHGDPIMALFLVANGFDRKTMREDEDKFKYLDTGEIRELPFVSLPKNESYELDLHKPYIDEAVLACSCGGDFKRVKEVMDVWFDSGSMPFAQDHYPFENKWLWWQGYPADYICEAIDQTRGWFYTLHAIGVLRGWGKAYKNVICLGHLLDAKGKKMSKSLGNVVDPWEMIEKYGVDTLRLWMYSVNQPGESKNFDEKTVLELNRQVFGLLYNVLAFYELYRDKDLEINDRPASKNILDLWILAELDELIRSTTQNLNRYKLLEPTRAIREFINDLSTWYLRRSRERIKEGDKDAKQTLYFVLKNLAKVLAPLAPFSSDDIWQKLKNLEDVESVHLASWPEARKPDKKLIVKMNAVRDMVSLGMEERQRAKIPVRQPLGRLSLYFMELLPWYVDLLKSELNVKDIVWQYENDKFRVELDTGLTPELKMEGRFRELVRALQDMRKNLELVPSESVTIFVDTDEKGRRLIQKFESELKKTVVVSEIEFKENQGEEIKIDNLVFKVEIVK